MLESNPTTDYGACSLSVAFWNLYKFTGKERDTESSLDQFGARYYASSMGRFMTPDWAPKPMAVPYANFGNPQSLNLYSYVENNPTTVGDPDGHCDFGCVFGIAMGIANGIMRDGGVKPYLNNVGTGILKGAGSTVVNALKFAAAGPNPGALAAAVMSPGPQALQPSNTTQAQASIVTQTVLPAAAGLAVGAAAGAGEGALASTTTSVTHFTSDAGMAAISESGTLNAGTWVTLPSEIPAGTSSAEVESFLEISPGKGANSITFDTPSSNLAVPGNGPTTSGGATQFQLKNPQAINPTKFKPTISR
jgi:RHS repeat-associated protein